MKKTLSLIAAFATTTALVTAPVMAGSPAAPIETPVIAPAAPVSPDWSGFYAGAGLGFADVDTSAPGIGGDDGYGGIFIGYDWDFGTTVFGLGLDYDFGDITLAPGLNLENVLRLKMRGGFEIGNGLAYFTTGWTQADTNVFGSADGYFVGLGYDYLVTETFSLGAEYLYHDVGSFGGTGVSGDASSFQIRGAFRF